MGVGEAGLGVPEGDGFADGVVEDRMEAAVAAKMLYMSFCRLVDG